MVPTEQNKVMGLTHSLKHQHFTHLENAGYKRNKKSQNISNFFMCNLRQIRGTQEKEQLEGMKHYDMKCITLHWVWYNRQYKIPAWVRNQPLFMYQTGGWQKILLNGLDTPSTSSSHACVLSPQPGMSPPPAPPSSQNPTHLSVLTFPSPTPPRYRHLLVISMGFLRQEYWSWLPFPFAGDLPNPGIEPGSPAF